MNELSALKCDGCGLVMDKPCSSLRGTLCNQCLNARAAFLTTFDWFSICQRIVSEVNPAQ